MVENTILGISIQAQNMVLISTTFLSTNRNPSAKLPPKVSEAWKLLGAAHKE
jgi:hypothetical protein